MFGFVLLACLVHALHRYLGAGRDDVFITLWAGKTLEIGHWFINYNGEPQEISSSILGALIAKFTYVCCTENYYVVNKLLGGGAALALFSMLWLQRRVAFQLHPQACAIATVLLLGFNSSFAYWSLGGLETPYYALLIFLYTVLAIRVFNLSGPEPRKRLYPYLGLVQIFAILCRPEGFWLIGVTAVLTLLHWKHLVPPRPSLILKLVILPTGVFLLVLLTLRYLMTGAIFPNPVYAKVSIEHLDGWREGLHYLGQFYGIGVTGPLLAGTTLISFVLVGYAVLRLLFPVLLHAPLGSRWLVPALIVCSYEIFIVMVKGDWMEYHRFLVPTLALKMLLLVMLAEWICGATPIQFRPLAAFILSMILLLVMGSQLQHVSSQDCSTRLSFDFYKKFTDYPNDAVIALNCAHRRDRYAIQPFIDHEMPRHVRQQGHLSIVTYQGGYFPYFIREKFSPRDITIVDTTGLLNLEIAKVEGEKIPTGNKYLDDIPAILGGEVPGLSERVSRYQPNMVYLLADSETQQARLKALGFDRILQAPGAVVYLKTGAPTRPPNR